MGVERVRVEAPGRVNLIGDHVDYVGGPVLPMAVDLTVTVRGDRLGDEVVLHSEAERQAAVVALAVADPAAVEPPWARHVAGVVAELRPTVGLRGSVSATLPVGAGLSSSAALQVAVALALGFEGTPLELALLCQRAEQRATGVPCGIMDQLAVTSGVAGHALLIDCHRLEVRPVPIPAEAEIVVVHSGESRRLAGSLYAERRAQCETVETVVGPLCAAAAGGRAGADALNAIGDPLLRRRARHVLSEIARVHRFVAHLAEGDLRRAGALMVESHRSLAGDFEVSTPALDLLVADLVARPGVHGARLTGAGFGGCVVALTAPGALRPADFPAAWVVRPSAGARLAVSPAG